MKTVKGSYRTADGKAQIGFEIEDKRQDKNGGPEFSACGEFDNSSGQCLEAIAKAYPEDATIQQIVEVWRKHHLNGMKSGTPEQLLEIEQARKTAESYARNQPKAASYFYDDEMTEPNWHSLCHLFGFDSYYAWECDILKQAKLYEVSLADRIRTGEITATGGFPAEVVSGERGYQFGERWLYAPIPGEVLKQIESWASLPAIKPLHQDTARQWLKDNGLKLRVTLSDSKSAPWEPSGHHYRVTLSRSGTSGSRGRLTFDFWGSQADAEEGKEPDAYSVLACIGSDAHTPRTFDEFCREYGGDADSIKAKQTFTRADRFACRLRSFLRGNEIETLSTIR